MFPKFNIEIRDKKKVENVVDDYLLPLPTDEKAKNSLPINEHFFDEQLFQITTHTNTSEPLYADIANYLATDSVTQIINPREW